MGRVEMGRVNALREQHPPKIAVRHFAAMSPRPEPGTEAVAALRRAIGPGLVEVALFHR